MNAVFSIFAGKNFQVGFILLEKMTFSRVELHS